MSLILGLDDFGEAVQSRLNFIDKSLFIKEIFDRRSTHVPVIIRPRRFGKTFNLSMLHHFLAAEVNGLKTANLFSNLKISEAGDDYMREQGQYPVISITFKSLKDKNFVDAYEQLCFLIAEIYREHRYLLNSDKLSEEDKKDFSDILKREVSSKSLLENSLKALTRLLYLHYGVKPWLLMDEYDTPIQSAWLYGYYDPMIELMRGLFGNALKGNPNIHRAVITGILRIAKENLFSGVNNLDVYSILAPEYGEHFGFTEGEVDLALKQAELTHLTAEIKSWYNGYHVGDYRMYNPWSIVNCVNKAGAIVPYWVNTSDNLLIRQTLARAEASVKEKLELILEGQPITALINENTVFSDLDGDGEAVWGLLLFAGYLTVIRSKQQGIKSECVLIPPNREVASLYPDIIASWFSGKMGEQQYHWLFKSLTEGDMDVFLEILQKFLRESLSYFDMSGAQPEKFYHGLVLGLMVGLSKTYRVQSNKESGFGRYDILLIPKDLQKLGLIIEFKVAKMDKTLQETAEAALAQINACQYETELQQQGVQRILKIGLGFRGKEVALASS